MPVLPNIEWECRLQVKDRQGVIRVVTTRVMAMNTDGAYATCEAMSKRAGYEIVASTITARPNGTAAQPSLPWHGEEKKEEKEVEEDFFPALAFTKYYNQIKVEEGGIE